MRQCHHVQPDCSFIVPCKLYVAVMHCGSIASNGTGPVLKWQHMRCIDRLIVVTMLPHVNPTQVTSASFTAVWGYRWMLFDWHVLMIVGQRTWWIQSGRIVWRWQRWRIWWRGRCHWGGWLIRRGEPDWLDKDGMSAVQATVLDEGDADEASTDVWSAQGLCCHVLQQS